MELGQIGLGKMGGNMAQRIRNGGHTVVGFDRSPDAPRDVDSLEALVAALPAPRAVWIMVPAGGSTDETVEELGRLLSPGDIVIDGGNSRHTDDARHAVELEAKGIGFIDAGSAVACGACRTVMP
jgi:6-phosphogluconate dehydrogenase